MRCVARVCVRPLLVTCSGRERWLLLCPASAGTHIRRRNSTHICVERVVDWGGGC